MSTRRVGRPVPLGKLRPPRLGRVFDRHRLFAEIEASAAVPGVWVAGPPGIGKTTLVATYVEACATPCLWLQLDAGDADPATFVHFLHAAAALGAPGCRLRLPLPTADDLRDVPGFIRRCFRRLVLALDPPWVLVLDNVQELGSARQVHYRSGPDDALRSGVARDRLFSFFAGEVMERLGPADATSLMRIAFLPSATAAMAVTLSGDARAGELLSDLARRSLFTDRREGPPPAYAFHALFGGVPARTGRGSAG